jgi:hypothetical protein
MAVVAVLTSKTTSNAPIAAPPIQVLRCAIFRAVFFSLFMTVSFGWLLLGGS